MKKYGSDCKHYQQASEQEARIESLKKELKRMTQERDILKEATVFLASEPKKNTRS